MTCGLVWLLTSLTLFVNLAWLLLAMLITEVVLNGDLLLSR